MQPQTYIQKAEKEFLKFGSADTFRKEAFWFSEIVNADPKLMQTTEQGRISAFLQIASWGVTLNPSAPDVYLIPRGVYKDRQFVRFDCQLMPRYTGLVKLAVRDSDLKRLTAKVVYEGDEIEYDFASEKKVIKHVPAAFTSARNEQGAIIACYVVGMHEDGMWTDEVMFIDEIHRVARDRSDSWKYHVKKKEKGEYSKCVWEDDEPEMCCKTVVKRYCKKIPKVGDALREAIDYDNSDYQLPPSYQQLTTIDSLSDAARLSDEEVDQCTAYVTTKDTASQMIQRLMERSEGNLNKAMKSFDVGIGAVLSINDKPARIEVVNPFGYLELRRIKIDGTDSEQTTKLYISDIESDGLTEYEGEILIEA